MRTTTTAITPRPDPATTPTNAIFSYLDIADSIVGD
jgi:hypothetical protein